MQSGECGVGMESIFASFFFLLIANPQSSIIDSQTIRNLEYRISLNEVNHSAGGWAGPLRKIGEKCGTLISGFHVRKN